MDNSGTTSINASSEFKQLAKGFVCRIVSKQTLREEIKSENTMQEMLNTFMRITGCTSLAINSIGNKDSAEEFRYQDMLQPVLSTTNLADKTIVVAMDRRLYN